MQLVGVYRNCICKAGIRYALPGNRAYGTVRVSTDNVDHRNSAMDWMGIGITGISFVGVLSVWGWLYQARIRARCKTLVENL
ncbi:hypothetical protein BCR34DRAFT_567918 [Clohesyomyces aquaticus]|uniref:Uncharacterized protein n=1 Tax=Clohesyomyces aquaticus TaxID=1231657 RepID=A0A1Y1ZHR0_9PLEO|nr:hypothetical protein BCR34DRAFT_567918 [Clohesyomyces aquaticus]